MFDNKFKYYLRLILILVGSVNVLTSKELVFRNSEKGIALIINEEGSIITNMEPEENADFSQGVPNYSLLFKYKEVEMIGFMDSKIKLKKYSLKKGSVPWSNYWNSEDKIPLIFKLSNELNPSSLLDNEGSFVRGWNKDFVNTSGVDAPNFVKKTSYLKHGEDNPITSTIYMDAHGREIQTQNQLNTYRYIVSGNYYDKNGRLSKSTLAAPLNSFGKFLKMDYSFDSDGKPTIDNFLDDINDYYVSEDKYPEAGRYAYSETEYHSDPLNRVVKTSSPGYDHRINGGHDVKSWTFGVSDCKNEDFIQFSDVENKESSDPYDIDIMKANIFLNNEKKDDADSKYFLSVSRDVNNKFSQSITDLDGKTLKVASFYKGELLVSSYEYDALGNLLKQNPPDENSAPSFNKYNSLGQIIESWNADKGKVTFEYNIDGSLKSKTDAKETTVAYSYDNLGRLLKIYDGDSKKSHIEKFYDYIENFNTSLTPNDEIGNILSELTNVRGKLFAEVSISDEGNVTDIYSYDEEGRINASYRLIPNMEWQKIKLIYNFNGNIECEIIYPTYLSNIKNNKPICKSYHYDVLGRLIAVKIDEKVDSYDDDKLLTTIEYDDMKVVSQTFYDCISGGAVYTRTTEDNILGWITKIKNKSNRNSTMLFEEVITYDGFYDGNISAAEYKYNLSGQQKNIKLNYKYDELTRLTDVKPASTAYSQYEEAFGYDKNSRLSYKVKGSNTPDRTYEYQTLKEAGYNTTSLGLSSSLYTNRLKGFSDNKNNYTYDANGGMILDKSKDLAIQRDWRGMPIMMKLREGQGSFANVSMLYDANGNRVLKKVLKTDGHSAIAYSIGGLIYHNENLDEDVKDYNLLSANIGGGRVTYYDEINKSYSDNFLSANFYLTDHLGSTRMSISGNGGVASSEFYYAYGEMDRDFNWNPSIDLMKVRDQFTGKEFDQEGENVALGIQGMNLYYFGARYYDPEIGLWISPDKAKQFYSLYAYPMNPVLITDPDGNFAPLAYIAINMAASAIIDAGAQWVAIQSGAQKEFHWGQFAASTVAGGVTSGINVGIAALGKSAGVFAAKTFGGMVARNLLSGAVDFGIRTTGAAWDAKHYDEVDFNRQVRNIALSSMASTVTNIGTNVLNYNANKSWDSVFDKMYDKFHPNFRTPLDIDPPMNVGENIVRELGKKTAEGAVRQTTYEFIIQIDIYYQKKQEDDGTIYLPNQNTDGVER